MDLKQKLYLQRSAIAQLAEQYGVHNLRIFGSVARDEEHSESDIDFLVDMDETRTLLDYIGFVQELEQLLGCKVDVAESDQLHPTVREQVLKEAIPL